MRLPMFFPDRMRIAAAALLRAWLRRIKHSTWARRIVFPLLQRFPFLQGPLRRLSEGAPRVRPLSSAGLAPEWTGPLPDEYAHMSESARAVLLDLARAGRTTPPP